MGGSLTNIVTTRHTLENYNMMEMGIWMATSATRDAAICQTATMCTSSIQASRRNKRRFAEWSELSSTPDINMETMCSGNLCTRGTNTKPFEMFRVMHKKTQSNQTVGPKTVLASPTTVCTWTHSVAGRWRTNSALKKHTSTCMSSWCKQTTDLGNTCWKKTSNIFWDTPRWTTHHGPTNTHQDTEPREKANTSPLTTPHAHRITTTLRKTIRIQLVCGMAHAQSQQAEKKRQSTQSETQSTTHKTHNDAGTERFTFRSRHRKRCRNDTTDQPRRSNLIKCLHKKTLTSDYFTETQTNKQTHHGGENFSRQIVTPTFTHNSSSNAKTVDQKKPSAKISLEYWTITHHHNNPS